MTSRSGSPSPMTTSADVVTVDRSTFEKAEHLGRRRVEGGQDRPWVLAGQVFQGGFERQRHTGPPCNRIILPHMHRAFLVPFSGRANGCEGTFGGRTPSTTSLARPPSP